MINIQHYYDMLEKYPDCESVSAIWAEANILAKQIEEIKKLCRQKLLTHLQDTGEVKVTTQTSVFGFTKPKPKLKLNERKWQNAILANSDLWQRIKQFELQKMHIAELQEHYMEEHYPEPRLYIK